MFDFVTESLKANSCVPFKVLHDFLFIEPATILVV